MYVLRTHNVGASHVDAVLTEILVDSSERYSQQAEKLMCAWMQACPMSIQNSYLQSTQRLAGVRLRRFRYDRAAATND